MHIIWKNTDCFSLKYKRKVSKNIYKRKVSKDIYKQKVSEDIYKWWEMNFVAHTVHVIFDKNCGDQWYFLLDRQI